MSLFRNSVPQSLVICCGISCLQIMLEWINLATILVLASGTATASVHLVKKSTAKIIYLLLVNVRDKGPITSMPTCEKGAATMSAEDASGISRRVFLFWQVGQART